MQDEMMGFLKCHFFVTQCHLCQYIYEDGIIFVL